MTVSSTLFALLHPDLLGAFAFGCIACLVRLRFDSLVAPILLHASHNGLVMLLLAFEVLVLGTDRMKVVAVGAVVVSILSYFWRLYPLSRKIDSAGHMTPTGYSRTLRSMILGFLLILAEY